MRRLSLLALCASAAVIAAQDGVRSDCPLAGPDFPAPKNLSGSPLIADAIAKLEASTNLGANDSAVAVALFSSKEDKIFYEHYFTPPMNVGVPAIDHDSIFRIGSISKVFTVWALLAHVGDAVYSHPITKYVPELAALSNVSEMGPDVVYDDINHVRWEDVTIGNLVSQAAGIPQVVTQSEFNAQPAFAEVLFSIPSLNQTEIPTCWTSLNSALCSRQQFYSYLRKQHPIFPTDHSPAYSNTAFHILGHAFEAITGKEINSGMTEGIFEPLGMLHSSYNTVPSSGGVIPGDPAASGWLTDMGGDTAAGGVYMSTGDLVTAGKAILQSTLLEPAQTRRWLKEFTQTGSITHAVGAPFEISYIKAPNKRTVRYFTKTGALGGYHAIFVLSPEHEVGWVVLTAGAPASSAGLVQNQLTKRISDLFMPAIQEQARVEAGIAYNGTYRDTATNSSVTIAAGDGGHAGISVLELVSHGKNIIGPEGNPLLTQLFGFTNSTWLFPTTLKTVSNKADCSGTYVSRLGFRMNFLVQNGEDGLIDPCPSWQGLGAALYGQKTIDDMVFNLDENGAAVSMDARGFGLTLVKED